MAVTYQQLFELNFEKGAELIITKMKIVGTTPPAGNSVWLSLGLSLMP